MEATLFAVVLAAVLFASADYINEQCQVHDGRRITCKCIGNEVLTNTHRAGITISPPQLPHSGSARKNVSIQGDPKKVRTNSADVKSLTIICDCSLAITLIQYLFNYWRSKQSCKLISDSITSQPSNFILSYLNIIIVKY